MYAGAKKSFLMEMIGMKMLDLFSGIGGFSLAAQQVWGEDHHIHSFVEIDSFCQKVLKKHWPDVPIWDDIRSYKHDGTPIDIICGGFPCQGQSVAGKRRGRQDDRWLWPEMFRVISEVHPRWVIAENVPGLISIENGMAFESALYELESEGYEVQSFIIPACAVGAPHRRDRVWIIAKSNAERCGWGQNNQGGQAAWRNGIETANSHAPNTNGLDGDNARYGAGEIPQQQAPEICGLSIVADTGKQGLQGLKQRGASEQRNGPEAYESTAERNSPSWDDPWDEVVQRHLCGVDDGLPRRMDRVKRLKALGNSIVPQVVIPIMRAIKE